SAVLRAARGAQSADRVPIAAGGDGGVLPEGRVAAARDPQRDLRRDDAVHGNPAHRSGPLVPVPGHRPVVAAIGLWPLNPGSLSREGRLRAALSFCPRFTLYFVLLPA